MSSSPGRSPRAEAPSHRRASELALSLALGAVGLAYAVQAFTPLRVETDSTEYLILATRVADSGEIPLQGKFPPGLPVLLGGLDAVGLGRSAWFVLLNMAFVALGAAAAAWLLRRELGYSRVATMAILVLTLLSFSAVRFVSHPLSDVPFFGVSLLALALAVAARRRESLWLLGAAAATTVSACSLRTVGLALLPALVVAVPARHRRFALPAFGVAAVLGLLVVNPRRYFDELFEEWGDDPPVQVMRHARELLWIVGEDGLNIPSDRLPGTVDGLLPLLGAILLVPIVAGAVLLARRSPVIAAYLAGTAAILLAWPFVAERFLLPVTPLLAACVLEAVRAAQRRAADRALWAWVAVFVVMGIGAVGTTTRITFSGDEFPERYGQNFRATYRVAWGTADAVDRRRADARMLWVLRRFEPRAIGTAGPRPQR